MKWKNGRRDEWMIGLLLCWLLASCGSNPLDVDVSKVNVAPVKIQRFDNDFFSLTAENIQQKLPGLQKKYPGFTDLFVRNILCHSGIQDSACIPEIIKFVNDKDMKGAFDECRKKFSDLSFTENALTDIFKHYKYYFPKNNLPKVLAMMSGFNYSIAAADSVFAIGLEMYLGTKNKFYEMLQIPAYKQVNMQKEFIVPDFLRAWMMREFPDKTKSGNLLSEMIYQGKLLYLADAMLPAADDTLKIGFTKKQLRWCIEHEKDMWGYLVKNKFLYSTEHEAISKFTGEGPFTTGFVKESPARTGAWLGWKIVRRYMEVNPKISLEELMKENDAQKILSLSKYKP
ncbi:MAG: gliding motility lipoprotein GldB [Bacteroidetes bacterium]|nr:gliding motility lipoprotein GldB [Bacteroidota bacterium]